MFHFDLTHLFWNTWMVKDGTGTNNRFQYMLWIRYIYRLLEAAGFSSNQSSQVGVFLTHPNQISSTNFPRPGWNTINIWTQPEISTPDYPRNIQETLIDLSKKNINKKLKFVTGIL